MVSPTSILTEEFVNGSLFFRKPILHHYTDLTTDPRIYKIVDVISEEFLKQDFDNSKKDMSINKKRIGSFKAIDVESYEFQDWVCFETRYNLKGPPFPLEVSF